MVKSYALSKARFLVDKCATKQILINNELFIKKCDGIEVLKPFLSFLSLSNFPAPVAPLACIALALTEIDIENEQPIKTPEEYFHLVFSHEDAAMRIMFFYYNFDVKNDDTKMETEEKRQIIENSIICFEESFESMLREEEYQEYQEGLKNHKRFKNHRTYEYILGSLKEKINYKNEYLDNFEEDNLKNILDSLSDINMNFYTEYKEGIKIYPLIVDMLSDMFNAEYFWHLDKPTIKKIIEAWSSTLRSQEKRKIHKYTLFEKMKLIQKVQYDSLRVYFLSEYARALNVDKKKLRTFMQYIFYYNVKNHQDVPKLDFDIINQIPPRPHMLEETKMVVGGV